MLCPPVLDVGLDLPLPPFWEDFTMILPPWEGDF